MRRPAAKAKGGPPTLEAFEEVGLVIDQAIDALTTFSQLLDDADPLARSLAQTVTLLHEADSMMLRRITTMRLMTMPDLGVDRLPLPRSVPKAPKLTPKPAEMLARLDEASRKSPGGLTLTTVVGSSGGGQQRSQLKRLTDAGWVETFEITLKRTGSPVPAVRITESGKEALAAWQAQQKTRSPASRT